MAYDVDIDVKVDGFIKDLSDLKRHLRRNAQHSLDRELDSDVEDLKLELLNFINSEIKTSSSVPNAKVKVPEPLDIPKAKTDILKEIFEADIKNSEIMKKGYTVDDTSNVFVVKNNRVKAWQSLSDSSTYAEQEQLFKERIKKGIFIDADSGKVYKVDPKSVSGLKLECSTDVGQTVDSEKKFEAYKNSYRISRRKYDGPYNRTAVWTIKQEDVNQMMKTALPLEGIIEKIQDGEYEIAKNILQHYNSDKSLDYAIDNIKDVQETGPSTTDFAAYKSIQEMINNLKIRKEISDATGVQGKVKYVLFTSYSRSESTEEVDFFNELKLQTQLWIATNSHKWFTVMVKAIEKAIMKYDSSKFTD